MLTFSVIRPETVPPEMTVEYAGYTVAMRWNDPAAHNPMLARILLAESIIEGLEYELKDYTIHPVETQNRAFRKVNVNGRATARIA
jgi:hypothetical protein